MNAIEHNLIQEIKQLSKENDEVLLEIQETNEKIKSLDLKDDDMEDYRTKPLPVLVAKDIFIIIFGIIVLSAISAAISAIGLAPIVAIVWILVLLGLAFKYFKLILITIILMLIVTFMVDTNSESAVITANMLVLVISFVTFRSIAVSNNRKMIEGLNDLNHQYHKNTENILHLIYQPLNHYIQSSVFVDMNSIKENGFSFVEEKYLQQYLNDEVERNHLKVTQLPQNNIKLYQSTKPVPQMVEMTTTHLQID